MASSYIIKTVNIYSKTVAYHLFSLGCKYHNRYIVKIDIVPKGQDKGYYKHANAIKIVLFKINIQKVKTVSCFILSKRSS